MIEVELVGQDGLQACLRIRRVVFIEGQNVPEPDDLDGLDPQCHHFLACEDGAPIGCARLRITEGGQAKAERVAVLETKRGLGVGHRIMDSLEQQARALGHAEVILGAQVQVIPFYEKRGYVAEGPEFMDAGIPHRTMRLRLSDHAVRNTDRAP